MLENMKRDEIYQLVEELKSYGYVNKISEGVPKRHLADKVMKDIGSNKNWWPYSEEIYMIADKATYNFRRILTKRGYMSDYRNKFVPFEKEEEWSKVVRELFVALDPYMEEKM